MRRREFIAGLGSAATWPAAARAQQPVPVIGWLDLRSSTAPPDFFDGFRRGLAGMGFVDGRNVSIARRYADGLRERLPALAAELVRERVAVIVAGTGPVALVAKAATQTIPVVFVMGGDPVEEGIVPSLNRPGGNVTGIAALIAEIAGKRLELLHNLMPASTRLALLTGQRRAPFTEAERKAIESAAKALGVHLLVFTASAETMSGDLSAAFASMVEQKAGALLIGGGVTIDAAREQIIALAARHALPTMFFYSPSVLEGGLLSYGPDVADANRQAGVYAGRILKGEKPADLPVVRSEKFELVINLKTANALGLAVPPTLLALADRVVE